MDGRRLPVRRSQAISRAALRRLKSSLESIHPDVIPARHALAIPVRRDETDVDLGRGPAPGGTRLGLRHSQNLAHLDRGLAGRGDTAPGLGSAPAPIAEGPAW